MSNTAPAFRARTLAVLAVLAAAGMSGCATSSSTRARSLETEGAVAAVADCRHATVTPFSVPSRGKANASTGIKFSYDIALRLKADFGPLFDSVEAAPAARGLDGECLISGAITKYKPGSRFARAMLIGLGPASFEGTVRVSDASGQQLLNAEFDKLWAWGGLVGAMKGIEEMVAETAAAVANTVARAKGWEPPAS